MSGKRYTGRGIFVNDNMSYQESFFENRDIKQLVQYETARFYYPTVAERQSMSVSTMIWTATSKLYNLVKCVAKEKHNLEKTGKHIVITVCTQGMPTDKVRGVGLRY